MRNYKNAINKIAFTRMNMGGRQGKMPPGARRRHTIIVLF